MNIGIIDIISFSKKNLYSKYTNPAFHSIMPQVIGVYLKRLGHKVWYYPYFGFKDLYKDLILDLDIVFISCYTMNAYLAYAISNLYKKMGVITVIGGPHARSFPDDCKQYFDYTIGKCDHTLIQDLLSGCTLEKLDGIHLSNKEHPKQFPLLEERWEFIQQVYTNYPRYIPKTISLISSTGCPNKCKFCIDSQVKYNQLSLLDMQQDLLFLKGHSEKYNVIWHDPNFGIKLNQSLDTIEDVNADNLNLMCELNLGKLNESICKRLQKNNFIALGPGLESWRSYNNKSLNESSKFKDCIDKVNYMSELLNMVNRYIPMIQVNIIFGLDIDTDIFEEEAFHATKLFMKQAPTVYANFQTFTIFGNSTPFGKDLVKENRVLKIPYNLLDGFSISNIVLKCDPSKFYKLYSNLLKYEKSYTLLFKKLYKFPSIYQKLFYTLKHFTGRLNISNFDSLSSNLKINSRLSDYFNGKSDYIPSELYRTVEDELGQFKDHLPHQIFNR